MMIKSLKEYRCFKITYTNSPNLSLVCINAHDLWSATAHARLRRGEAPVFARIPTSGGSIIPPRITIDSRRRDAIMCRPCPIILWIKDKVLLILIKIRSFNFIAFLAFLDYIILLFKKYSYLQKICLEICSANFHKLNIIF